jgi:hypothetical protein
MNEKEIRVRSEWRLTGERPAERGRAATDEEVRTTPSRCSHSEGTPEVAEG